MARRNAAQQSTAQRNVTRRQVERRIQQPSEQWSLRSQIATWCETASRSEAAFAVDSAAHAGDPSVVGDAAGTGRSARCGKVAPTLRGKVMAAVMVMVLACAGLGMLFPQVAHSDMGDMALTTYTVRAGDTLWDYASRITPAGEDVSETVIMLMDLNDLDDVGLQIGQKIVVPAV